MRLALVSLPEISGFARIFSSVVARHTDADIDQDATKRELIEINDSYSDAHFDYFVNALECAAREEHADVICVNELGFPTRKGLPREDAMTFVAELAREQECFVVAGTVHDHRTLYNTAYLFSPSAPSPHQYHKQVSAWRGTGELVSVPSMRTVPVAKAFGITIGTLVCLDICDYAAAKETIQRGVDLLLVPAYAAGIGAERGMLSEAAQILSATSRCSVALVNCHDGADVTSCLWECGKLRPPDTSRTYALPCADEGGSAARVAVYELDVRKLQHGSVERFAVKEFRPSGVEWMFDILGPRRSIVPMTGIRAGVLVGKPPKR